MWENWEEVAFDDRLKRENGETPSEVRGFEEGRGDPDRIRTDDLHRDRVAC
jgi:hypothetical protein